MPATQGRADPAHDDMTDLPAALRLLEHFTGHNTAPCRIDARGWCLAHWHYSESECPFSEARDLLARHRPTT